jgi:hypothetical protein
MLFRNVLLPTLSGRRLKRQDRESSFAMRILLLEDHERLAQSIVDGLSQFGFGVDAFATAEGGIGATASLEYDAIIRTSGCLIAMGLTLSTNCADAKWRRHPDLDRTR